MQDIQQIKKLSENNKNNGNMYRFFMIACVEQWINVAPTWREWRSGPQVQGRAPCQEPPQQQP